MGAEHIDLVPIGPVPDEVMDHLPGVLEARFRRGVRVVEPISADPRLRNESRRQWRSDLLLVPLSAHAMERSRWSLGVMDDDLYTPGLNFVFGQARRGAAGVIGLARLYPTFYSERPDTDLVLYRAEIEAVHEIGHVAGLDHCPDPSCVMRFSNNIGHTDVKGSDFCAICRALLDARLGAPSPRPPRAPLAPRA